MRLVAVFFVNNMVHTIKNDAAKEMQILILHSLRISVGIFFGTVLTVEWESVVFENQKFSRVLWFSKGFDLIEFGSVGLLEFLNFRLTSNLINRMRKRFQYVGWIGYKGFYVITCFPIYSQLLVHHGYSYCLSDLCVSSSAVNIMAQLGYNKKSVEAKSPPRLLKIKIPKIDNSELLARSSKVMMGRCLNPNILNMDTFLFWMPQFWNLVGQELERKYRC